MTDATLTMTGEETQTDLTTETPTSGGPRMSRMRKIMRGAAWTSFAIGCLIFFTVFKLPEDRLKNYINGTISAALAPRGITFTAAKSDVSIGLGISYEMKDVTINLPPPEAPLHVDEIEVAPSFLPLLLGRVGGKLWLYNGDGWLKASFAMKALGKQGSVSASYKIKELNLGKLGILPIAAGIKGSAIANGTGTFSGDINQPSSWEGELELTLSKIVLDKQSIQGFAIPKLSVADGVAEIVAGGGKATIKSLRLGKPGGTDDLSASASGDVTLGKDFGASSASIKTRFTLSKTITDDPQLALLPTLLTPARQQDGSYGYSISGPLYAPVMAPLGGQ